MKSKLSVLLLVFALAFNVGFSQDNSEDCNTNLQIFADYAKGKKYDDAYGPWMDLKANCAPNYNYAIYAYGAKILKHKLKTAEGEDKAKYAKDLVALYDDQLKYYPEKSKVGMILFEKAYTFYDYKEVFKKTDLEIYEAFDAAFEKDAKTIASTKGIYAYFNTLIKLYDNKEKKSEVLLDKYEEVCEKIEALEKDFTQKLNKYQTKEGEEEKVLSSKDKSYKKYYESSLKGYAQITKGINKKFTERANCENLVPLYERNFEENKNNEIWLQRAMNRLYSKECTDSKIFVSIVEQKNELAPNADTAYYVGILKDKAGKSNEAIEYYKQAIELESDSYEKAKILYKVAGKFKDKGSYSSARSYYRQALAANPSMGKCYLKIAAMYAKSANNCGESAFNKRAVYWLAESEVLKAGKVDKSLASQASKYAKSYGGKAPTKSEIFSSGRSGEVIKIGCWIGSSVTVPSVK